MIKDLITLLKNRKTLKSLTEIRVIRPAEYHTAFQMLDILTWHKKTFPTFTYQEQKEKLTGEIREFEEALEKYIRTGSAAKGTAVNYELADVVIAGINLMRYEEARKLVKEKMEINYTRTWKGGQHKEQKK